MKEVQPTKENSKILTEHLQSKVNVIMKEKHPTAENLVDAPEEKIVYNL